MKSGEKIGGRDEDVVIHVRKHKVGRVKNEEVRKKLNIGEVSTKLREAKLLWAGHVWLLYLKNLLFILLYFILFYEVYLLRL